MNQPSPTPVPVLLDALQILHSLLLEIPTVIFSDPEFLAAGLDSDLVWRLHLVAVELQKSAISVGWEPG